MIEPTLDDVGRKVIYRDLGGQKIEEGTITSFNVHYVFVRYGSGSTSAATARRDLEWSNRKPGETAVREVRQGRRTVSMDFCAPPEPPPQ